MNKEEIIFNIMKYANGDYRIFENERDRMFNCFKEIMKPLEELMGKDKVKILTNEKETHVDIDGNQRDVSISLEVNKNIITLKLKYDIVILKSVYMEYDNKKPYYMIKTEDNKNNGPIEEINNIKIEVYRNDYENILLELLGELLKDI